MTYQYKVGEWYKTRGGYEAQVLDVNYNGHVWYRIIGKIKVDGRERIIVWMIDGAHCSDGTTHEYDLVPSVERKEMWVNVHPECAVSWWSKEQADTDADADRIGMIRITIEGDDFKVERVM